MSEFKGSILELSGNKATIMTNECDFLIIKRQPYMRIGQEINFQKSDIRTPVKSSIKYIGLIAGIFILALTYILYNQLFIASTAYAFVDVDINPSMEFAIDKDAKVMDIKPLNDDAQILLKKLKLNDLYIKQAIAEVIQESKRQGFIKQSKYNPVLISASLGSEKTLKSEDAEKKLDNILTDIKSTSVDVGSELIKPDILKVTYKDRTLAVKNKISMGRYVLYNKIKQKDKNISVEDAKKSNVSEMLDEVREKDSGLKPKYDVKDKKEKKEENKKGENGTKDSIKTNNTDEDNNDRKNSYESEKNNDNKTLKDSSNKDNDNVKDDNNEKLKKNIKENKRKANLYDKDKNIKDNNEEKNKRKKIITIKPEARRDYRTGDNKHFNKKDTKN